MFCRAWESFENAIAEIKRLGLTRPILRVDRFRKPFLGICLGLCSSSGATKTAGTTALGALRGEVVRFRLPPDYSVPHMGWNQAIIRRRAPILDGIEQGAYFYFVHSYYVVPEDKDVVAVETDYHEPFCAMVWRGSLFATQFHPEKSQAAGLKLLKNFAEL